MTRPWSWDRLRRLSLARQFPRLRGRGTDGVARLVDRVGPLQTQTARSAFLGIAARLPAGSAGADHAGITAAYECCRLVRGSSIRGTVHTSTPEQHVWLDRATRVGQRALWARTLRLHETSLEEVWTGTEEFATPAWRDVDALGEHLRGWLADRGERATDDLAQPLGRSLTFGHGGLVRRPLSGGWEGQGRPAYRWVGAALADVVDRDETTRLEALRTVPHAEAMAALVRMHLRSHGPASRHDVAWWAGIGLRDVDTALLDLGEELTVRPGPDGRDYWDLADGVPAGVDDVGTRLLPEFDALLCGYDPRARTRFVTADHHAVLWNQQNGLLRAPVLHEGRLSGWWRSDGPTRARRVEVTPFAGLAPPSTADLAPAVETAAAAMGWRVDDVVLLPPS